MNVSSVKFSVTLLIILTDWVQLQTSSLIANWWQLLRWISITLSFTFYKICFCVWRNVEFLMHTSWLSTHMIIVFCKLIVTVTYGFILLCFLWCFLKCNACNILSLHRNWFLSVFSEWLFSQHWHQNTLFMF